MAENPFAAQTDSRRDDAAEEESFFQGGLTSAKWPTVGHVNEGDVLDWSFRDQTDADTRELMYVVGGRTLKASETPNKTGDGFPRARQLILEVQGEPTGLTWESNRYNPVELPDDDGVRTIWVKGTLKFALNQAIQKAGREMGLRRAPLERGAHIRVERVKDGPKMPGAKGAPYRYEVVWTPASKNTNSKVTDDPWAKESVAAKSAPVEDEPPF